MIFQEGVIPENRPPLHFLWRKNPTTKVAVFQCTCHIFGSKDLPTCANYALQQTATDNQSEFPEASQTVCNNFHMDEYLELNQAVEQATRRPKIL